MSEFEVIGRGYSKDSENGGDYFLVKYEDESGTGYYILKEVSFVFVHNPQSSTQTAREVN